MSEPTLRELVFTALDNAIEGGHGPDLAECTPLEVAGDILAYDDDVATNLNAFELEDACKFVEMHVKAWRLEHPEAAVISIEEASSSQPRQP